MINKLLAATSIPIAPNGGFQGFGPLGTNLTGEGQGIKAFTKFISSTIGLMTIIAIIWFTFVLITGAIGWISAGGDKAAVETAKKRITNGLIGLVVVVAAIFIIDLVGYLIGIKNILDISNLFDLITGGSSGGGGASTGGGGGINPPAVMQ